jgi:hypothetical protein
VRTERRLPEDHQPGHVEDRPVLRAKEIRLQEKINHHNGGGGVATANKIYTHTSLEQNLDETGHRKRQSQKCRTFCPQFKQKRQCPARQKSKIIALSFSFSMLIVTERPHSQCLAASLPPTPGSGMMHHTCFLG